MPLTMERHGGHGEHFFQYRKDVYLKYLGSKIDEFTTKIVPKQADAKKIT